jgi:DNA-binding NarL/FixJ family response regulator
MLITRTEKEKLVIKLAEEGKTTRQIAKEVHISLKDIGKI